MSKLKDKLVTLLRPRGKLAFVRSLRSDAEILDIGCGNEAVVGIKNAAPGCRYTGVDIGDYNQTARSKRLMDEYVIVDVRKFADGIRALEPRFDGVISSHNLEHCDDLPDTLSAMLSRVKKGGKIYMSFPCKDSVNFPSRRGTLNFYDDETHKSAPPNYDAILSKLKESGFTIEFATARYRPILLRAIGLLTEPFSAARKRVMKGTWELYGFESVIIAAKA